MGPHRDGRARSGSTACAARRLGETFEPRDGLRPVRLRDARTARVRFSPAVARWEVEQRRPTLLVDGAALAEQDGRQREWLSARCPYRGEAVVLEPPELRAQVALRARALAAELRPARRAA